MSESILSRRKAFFLSPETSSLSYANNNSLSSTQSLVDGLMTRFIDEAADVKTLAALTAGGLAYRWGKISVLNVGAIRESPLLARPLSIAFGLGGEVTAFEFTNRTLQSFSPSPVTVHPSPSLWSWNGTGGWKQSLINDLFTFGLLKGAGFLSRESNVVFQHAFSSTAMVAGHQTTAFLGVTPKPEGSLAEQLLHAEITNLQLGAGTSLVHSMAPGIVALERGLDLSLQSHPRATGRSPLQIGPRLALAEGIDDGGGRGPSPWGDLKKNSHILQMSAPEDPSSGGPFGKTASSEVVSDQYNSTLSLASQLGVEVSSFREGQDFKKIAQPLRTKVMDLISRPEISLSLSSGSLRQLRHFVIGGVESLSEVESSLQELIEKGREKKIIPSLAVPPPPAKVLSEPVLRETKPVKAEGATSLEPALEEEGQGDEENIRETIIPETNSEVLAARLEIARLNSDLREALQRSEKVTELLARVTHLEELQEQTKSALRTEQENHVTASTRVRELEGVLDTRSRELMAALELGQIANTRVVELEGKLKSAKKDLATATENHRAASARITELETELRNKGRELEEALEQGRNADDRASELKGSLDTATTHLTRASARITELERDLGLKGQKLEAALSEGAKANSRAEGWKQTHDEMKQKAEGIIGEYRAQAEALEVEIRRVRAENAHISQLRTETLDQSIAIEANLRAKLTETEIKARLLSNQVIPTQIKRDMALRSAEEKEIKLQELGVQIEEMVTKLQEMDLLKRALGETVAERDQAQVLLRAAKKDVDRINGYRFRAIEARKRANDQFLKTQGELRGELGRQKEALETLERENAFLSRDRDSERARADREKARADALSQRVDELETQVPELNLQLEKAREAITLAGRRIAAKETQLEGELGNARRQRAEIERLKGIIDEAGRQAEAKDGRIRELKQKIRELNEVQDITLQAESEEEIQLKAQVAGLESEKQDLVRARDKAQGLAELQGKQIAAAFHRAASLEGQLGRNREALERKEREHGELLRRFTVLDREVLGIRGEADRRVKLEAVLAKQVEENIRLRGKMEGIQARLTQSNEEVARLKEELEFAQGDVAVTEGSLNEKEEELKKVKEEFESKKVEMRQATEELLLLRNDQRAKGARLESLTRRETWLNERVGKLREERDELRQKVEERKSEVMGLRRRLDESEVHATSLGEKLGETERMRATLEKSLSEATRKLGILEGDLILMRKAESVSKSARQQLQRENELLTGKVKTLQPLVDRTTQAEGKVKDLSRRIEELLQEIQGTGNNARDWETKAKEANQRYEEVQRKLIEKEQEAAQARARVEELEIDLAILRDTQRETAEKAQTSSTAVDEAKERLRESAERVTTLEGELASASAEVERLGKELLQSDEERARLAQQIETTVREAKARLAGELAVVKAEAERLGRELLQSNEERAKLALRIETTAEEAKARVEENTETIRRLEGDLATANAEAERLGKDLLKSNEERTQQDRRIDELLKRRPTPVYYPQIADAQHSEEQARRAVDKIQLELTTAEQNREKAEKLLGEERTKTTGLERELRELRSKEEQWKAAGVGLQREIDEKIASVEQLQNVLAARGAAFFENRDPRVGKVETSLKKSKSLTDKTGQIIGKAEILAGGAESTDENPTRMIFEDGSLLSAKTTIGVPKKGQKVNEDAVYFSHFILPSGLEVKVIAGADGAGGHGSGDVAASAFLQGIHAQVAEKAYQGEIPEAKDLFEQGRLAVDRQTYHPDRPHSPGATGAGAVIVIVGNQATIATAGDSLVVLSRKQADGSYRSEGYSNSDSADSHIILNGIHWKRPKARKSDQNPEDAYDYSQPPRLYGVKDLRPGDRFTLGSDGFHNSILGGDYSNYGSKDLQYAFGQRPCLLQQRFQLLNLLLKSTAGRDDAANYFHDWVLNNMRAPGGSFEYSGEAIHFPDGGPDNIFAISYEQGGEVKNGSQRISSEYQPLEKVFDVPPPPFGDYKKGTQAKYQEILGRYLDPLRSLYGPTVGEDVAHTLANLYRNFPSLEQKFNPVLLAKAPDIKATHDLLDALKNEIEAHPEVKAGDNKRFMEDARADMKKIREAAHPFEEASPDEVRTLFQKYQPALEHLFGTKSGVAAKYFADLFKNFPKIEESFNPEHLAVLEPEPRKKEIRKTMGVFHTDRSKPTELEQMKKGFQAIHEIGQMNEKGPEIFMAPGSPSPGVSLPSWDLKPDKVYVIGRKDRSDIVIDNSLVSSQHLRIYKEKGHWYAEDMGSRNGTMVNGQMLKPQQPMPLSPSGISVIFVGNKELMLMPQPDGGAILQEVIAPDTGAPIQ